MIEQLLGVLLFKNILSGKNKITILYFDFLVTKNSCVEISYFSHVF